MIGKRIVKFAVSKSGVHYTSSQRTEGGYVEAITENLERNMMVIRSAWDMNQLRVMLYLIFVEFLLYQKRVEESACRKITFALPSALL
jgi:hypothetical protein